MCEASHLIIHKKSNMKHKYFYTGLQVSLIFLVTLNLYAQSVLTVPAVYKDIQTALNAANEGDTVLVQPGHYYENLKWPEMNGISLISAGTPQNTIIDGNGVDRVIEISTGIGFFTIDSTTLIQGFTIMNGHLIAPGAYAWGAGIYLEYASPVLRNLVVRNNISTGDWCYGAGIHLMGSNSLIENIEVTENILESTSWSYGAGIYIDDGSNPIIKNALISKNKMMSGATWYYGGGIFIDGGSHVQLINSVISFNELIGSSGHWYYGAGISCEGILARSSVDIINCTIVNNYETNNNQLEGGGLYIEGSDANVVNSIIWNNGGSEIQIDNFIDPVNLEVRYSDIKGGWTGIGNINNDPLFISNESYFLKLESPCLGAGTLIHAPQNDILGNPRPSPVRSNPDMGAVEMDQDFSHVLAVVFYDENQNSKFDPGEHLQQDGSVEVFPSKQYLLYNNASGILAILKTGKYQIEFNPSSLPNWHLTTGTSLFDVDVNTKNFADTIYFGVAPDVYFSDLTTNIYSPPLRCNETIKFSVFVKNQGSRIENGILWFTVDERLSTLNFLDKPDTIISPNNYGWYYSDLYPGEGRMKCVKIKIPGIDVIMAGELIHFKSYIEEPDNTFTLKSNVFYYDPPQRCSVDPNDKMVNPMRANSYTLFDEDLIYTIRFQNTGNDLAYRVVIRDTLDAKLDGSSFQVLNSSHPDQLVTELTDNSIVTFSFENIRLPYEKQDKDGSNGFVCYKIKSIANVPEQSQIQNTASIYFDYNPSIRTNTTQSILVEKLPTANSQFQEDMLGIKLFPNPATNYLRMTSDVNKPINYVLFTSEGKKIKQGQFTGKCQLNLESIQTGIYFLEFRCSKYSELTKLIISK
jgi:uncharacterized repeat protein (TIGR01451 family)